jgi:hypothetical protein
MTVNRIDQVLPQQLIDRLHDQLTKQSWHYGWHSNANIGYSHWNHSYVKAGSENGLDMSEDLTGDLKQAWDYISTLYARDHILLRCYSNAHTYGIEGYPHRDSTRPLDKTIVIYINKNWPREWSGETVVYDGDTIIASQLPKYNSGLMFNGNQTHSARPPSRICPELRITLMFKIAPRGYDLLRDQVQRFITTLGTKQIKHRDGKLFNHLLRVYDMLKNKGADSYTQAAGGLHSIMGTDDFKLATLDPLFKHRIAELFGEETARLVDLFSRIKKTQALDDVARHKLTTLVTREHNTIELDRATVDSLLLIEAANLKDQNSLNKYEHLKKFWNTYDGPTKTANTATTN